VSFKTIYLARGMQTVKVNQETKEQSLTVCKDVDAMGSTRQSDPGSRVKCLVRLLPHRAIQYNLQLPPC
jgi:hypothetical protein